nr:putative reverse transcriptase domain-containing protein [Tanacetum cinerariifolium]
MASNLQSGPNNNNNNNENPDIATIIARQLQTILPQIVTQVTNNVNNANGRNGGNGGNGINNGCTYKGFMACNPKEYKEKGGAIALTRWIEKMENVINNSGCAENQKVKYAASSFINKALTWWNTQVQERGREAAIGMSWADFKALLVEEFCPSNEMKKLESEFWNHKMVGANHVGYTDRFPELAKLVTHLVTHESSRIKRILNDEAVIYGTLTKGNEKRKGVEELSKQGGGRNDNKRAKVAPINAVRGGYEPGTCYECESRKHYQNTCPKLNLSPGQVRNRLTIEGNRNSRNNRNQLKGRAFNVNAVGALQDPNVVVGTFSLNHHYATVLFDSGADFSFISTSFAPLLNVKSSFVNPGYLIEVANGHGSFDVIVGMDWLFEYKAEIVCHKKVVRIPLESGEILIVQEEHTPGISKALSNVKVDEPKLSDIFIVRDLVEVFSEDLSGLRPQRQVEFRIDLVLQLLKKEELYAKFSKLYRDASNQGLGCVLMQRSKVISYASRQLKIHEKNYATHDLELRAVVFAFKTWRHYLYGTKSVIYTYHKSLQHIFDQKELNMRQRRWIMLFSDYECDFRYHPGKANVVAGALSRKERVKPRRVRAMAMTIQSGIRRMIIVAQGEALKQENILAEKLLVGGVRTIIMDETYKTRYFVHPGADKMYHDIRNMYWWPGMMRDIAFYVRKCLTCSKVKAEHQRPSGLLQQPEIIEWKWDKITMDFITKLPRSKNGHDTIWVIVDRLTKLAHFLAIREDYSMERLERIYIDEIVARHEVPVSIISERDGQFTSRCWQTVQKALGKRLDMSMTYHPQTDGQSLYGRKCRLPILWAKIEESSLIGPELVQETTDKVVLIKEKLKAARDCQKSYADNRRKSLECKVGDRVMLKVSPWKGVIHFRKKGKLAPRYVGPFEILERIGPVAYRLRLPEELSGTIACKICWKSKRGLEFTWEREDFMKSKYPHLFVDRADE